MYNHVLIIDDDVDIAKQVQRILEAAGLRTSVSTSGPEAIEMIQDRVIDLVLLDIMMPDMDGFAVFDRLRQDVMLADVPVIFVTAVTDGRVIAKCYDVGATDYISKPIREHELLARVGVHLQMQRSHAACRVAEAESKSLRHSLINEQLEHEGAFARCVTVSPTMRRIFKYVEAIASSPRPVLVTGETGVGKQLIVEALYALSGQTGELVTLNVAGHKEAELASTLFGRSADGHGPTRTGLIERAAGGTLFLDGVGDLDEESQLRLIQLLEDREYFCHGSDQRRWSDARIIAASNRDLNKEAMRGTFRLDLYYRLANHAITVPPLRDRLCDVPVLLNHFVTTAADQLQVQRPRAPGDLLQTLFDYDWPGNVRELENMVHDSVRRAHNRVLELASFDACRLRRSKPRTDTVPTSLLFEGSFPKLKDLNSHLIEEALERCDGNQTMAAQLLGLTRQALNKRLRRATNGDFDS